MWQGNRLCDLFGIKLPILQAPMAGSATPALAAAVSNAGGLGGLGCGVMEVAAVRAARDALVAGTNRPFNLNFFTHPAPAMDADRWQVAAALLAPAYAARGLGPPPAQTPGGRPGFLPEMLDLLLDLRPRVVSFHFGLPGGDAVAKLRAAGVRVIATATSVAEARALEAGGVDAVIAQGWEAGGHRGSFTQTAPDAGVGLMALLPQVVDAVHLPVIAAGGIADGRGIAAALALGASGVQIGTAFLSCPEAGTSAVHRAALASATDTDTVPTAAFSGRTARARLTGHAESMRTVPVASLPDYPALYALTDPLAAPDATGHDRDHRFLLYGQAAPLNSAVPAADLMAQLQAETSAVLARLASG